LDDHVGQFEMFSQYFIENFNLDSSLRSLLFYMKGMVQLKSAEVEVVFDKKILQRNFKLAILYRPDLANFILAKIS
jgi:hypothetical protein